MRALQDAQAILQTCFFAISGVLPRDRAVEQGASDPQDVLEAGSKIVGAQRGGGQARARRRARDTYEDRHLHRQVSPLVPASAPQFVREVTAAMMAGRGDQLPVSALPVDGTFPSGAATIEKRRISDLVAEWVPGHLHPVRHLQLRVPARDPLEVLRRGRAGGGPRGVQERAARRGRSARDPLHAAGLRRGLHRLWPVHRGLPSVTTATTRPMNLAPPSHRSRASRRTSPSSRRCRSTTGRAWTSGQYATSSCSPCSSYSGRVRWGKRLPGAARPAPRQRLTIANATGYVGLQRNLPAAPWTKNAAEGAADQGSLFEDDAELRLGLRAGGRPAHQLGRRDASRRAARRHEPKPGQHHASTRPAVARPS